MSCDSYFIRIPCIHNTQKNTNLTDSSVCNWCQDFFYCSANNFCSHEHAFPVLTRSTPLNNSTISWECQSSTFPQTGKLTIILRESTCKLTCYQFDNRLNSNTTLLISIIETSSYVSRNTLEGFNICNLKSQLICQFMKASTNSSQRSWSLIIKLLSLVNSRISHIVCTINCTRE